MTVVLENSVLCASYGFTCYIFTGFLIYTNIMSVGPVSPI